MKEYISIEAIVAGVEYGVSIRKRLLDRAIEAGFVKYIKVAVLTKKGRKLLEAMEY